MAGTWKEHPIFREFLRRYLYLLLVPTLFIAAYCAYLYRVAAQQARAEVEMSVTRLRDIMEVQRREIDVNVVNKAASDGAIVSALGRAYQPNTTDIIYLYRAMRALGDIQALQNDTMDIAAVSLRNASIISDHMALRDLDLFFRTQYAEPRTAEQWRARYFPDGATSRYVSDTSSALAQHPKERIVSYIRYLPGTPREAGGCWIWVRWRESDLLRSVSHALGGNDSLYVINGDGELLASKSGARGIAPALSGTPAREGVWTQRVDGRAVLFAQITSSSGLTYCAAVDEWGAMAEVRGMVAVLCASVAIMVCAFYIVARMLAARNVRPMQPVLTLMRGGCDVRHESYESLMRSIGEALRAGNLHREEAEKQRDMLRGMLVERLLAGGITDEEWWEERVKPLGVDLRADHLAVLLVEVSMPLDAASYGDDAMALIGHWLERMLGDAGVVHYDDGDRLTLIIKLGDAPEATLSRRMAEVREGLDRIEDTATRVACGGLCDGLSGLPALYQRAMSTLAYAEAHDMAVCNYDEMPGKRPPSIYPASTELKLLNHLRAGNAEEVSNLLREIVAAYDTPHARAALVGALIASLYRALDGIDEKALSPSLTRRISVLPTLSTGDGDALTSISEAFTEVAREIAAGKGKQGELLRQRMLNLVDERYASAQFCMQEMLDALDMRATHFQEVFREQVGTSFYRYLEDLRLRKACAWLTTTEDGIAQIAEHTGYGSPATFRRAFKKMYGVSPADYRCAHDEREEYDHAISADTGPEGEAGNDRAADDEMDAAAI